MLRSEKNAFCKKNIAYSIAKAYPAMSLPDQLLRSLPLSGVDAARLVLELVEGLQLEGQGMGHDALMERLRVVLRLGLQALREREQTVSFAEAARRSIEARAGRRPVTLRDLRYYLNRLLREPGLAARPLRAMRSVECRCLLQRVFGHSPHGFRKARAILHSVFAYGLQQEWCAHNPVDHVVAPAPVEKEIQPLPREAIERLERAASLPQHVAMQLPLHLMLYCGIRPAEVQRLRAGDIDWQEGMVRIRPAVSKTGGGRLVPLRFPQPLSGRGQGVGQGRTPSVPPSLPEPSARILPRGWERRWRALRRAAGFTRWVPDVLRHTFASYHAAHFRNLPALQLEMGHRDSSLLRSRYVSVEGVTRETAAHFFCTPRRNE